MSRGSRSTDRPDLPLGAVDERNACGEVVRVGAGREGRSVGVDVLRWVPARGPRWSRLGRYCLAGGACGMVIRCHGVSIQAGAW